MGHYKESFYANLLFKNDTILTSITTTYFKPTRKTATTKTHTIVAKKPSQIFLPVVYNGNGMLAFIKARELFLASNWGISNFQSIGAHYRYGSPIRAAN